MKQIIVFFSLIRDMLLLLEYFMKAFFFFVIVRHAFANTCELCLQKSVLNLVFLLCIENVL